MGRMRLNNVIMNTIPEPNIPNNSVLTPEKFQEIKSALESENSVQFPSAFQMARNLLKQAWTSSIDVARGQPLLASAEKSKARMDICKGCEFLRDTRCVKCGCFMDKKVHIESAQCPTNKWGADLQKLYPAEIAQKNLESPHRTLHNIDIHKEFSADDAAAIDRLATESLEFDGRFSWKGMQFKAIVAPNGARQISQLQPKISVVTSMPNHKNLSVEEQIEFNNLLVKHQAPDQNKVFAYKSQIFHLTPRTSKDAKPGQFMINVIDPNNPPPGVVLPPTVPAPTT